MKVLYLLTSFPLLSETFVKREICALTRLSVDLDIYSLWGGKREFEGHPVNLFPKRRMLSLLWWLPFWIMKRPGAFARLLKDLCTKKPGSLENLGA
ncbi:MAG TPA: colanic acid biosynthesis glycosyltransferase WcaL, partial [Gammaproteobacteria bacterium]|nr:colanic acid biosynthesis glycosyltransferase WcaL [Gammaproteobacteria bacterium]